MESLTKEEKAANYKVYTDSIAKPSAAEPMVLVRVVTPPGLWWGPSPNTHKLYGEGETLMVPESVLKNSDFHTTRRGVSGQIIRGVLERADMVKPVESVHSDDLKAVLARNAELERQIAMLAGGSPVHMEPTVIVPDAAPEKRGPSRPKKASEEI